MARTVLCKFDGVHSSKEEAPKAKGQMKSELLCFPLIPLAYEQRIQNKACQGSNAIIFSL